MKKILFLILLCLLGGVCAEAQSKQSLSVIVVGDVDEAAKDVVYSAMKQRLSGNKKYKVYERNKNSLKALEKEQNFQLSGDVPESEIRAVGKRMGVDYVAGIYVKSLDNNRCMITGSIYDLVTGETLKSCTETRELEDSETLEAIANYVAYRLFAQK